jgi:hypothetical protein
MKVPLQIRTTIKEMEEDTKKSKKKVALLLGFLGTHYGVQVNANQRPLQAVIELACYQAGMLNLLNFGYPFKMAEVLWQEWTRASMPALKSVCSR